MPIEPMNGFEPTWLLLNQIISMLAENCLEKNIWRYFREFKSETSSAKLDLITMASKKKNVPPKWIRKVYQSLKNKNDDLYFLVNENFSLHKLS